MKDKSKKHDHKGTKLLKLSIFFTIMLAPILAIAFKCAYVTFNKNAYQSYSDELVEKQVQITNPNELIENQVYIFNYKEYDTTNYEYIPYITYENINVDWSNYTTSDVSNVVSFRVRTNDNFMQLKNSDNSTINLFDVWGNTLKTITFTFLSKEYSSSNAFMNISAYGIYYNTQKLDNAFYYAIDEMQESSLFNWTENTAIYTPIHAMTSGLGITTDAIAILLTYWMYITLIYIVFDIVIELFTYLTHTLMGQPM